MILIENLILPLYPKKSHNKDDFSHDTIHFYATYSLETNRSYAKLPKQELSTSS